MGLPKLLVVEDDKNDLELLLMVLRQADFEVNIATRGEDAKRMLLQTEYDTVLLNLSLPDMDGLELVRWCQEKWASMPIQIVTGHFEQETRMKAFQAGACYFWAKPYESVANLAILKVLQIRRLAFDEGRASRSPRTTTWGIVTSCGIATLAGGYVAEEKLKIVSEIVGQAIQAIGLIMAVLGPALHGRSAQDEKGVRR